MLIPFEIHKEEYIDHCILVVTWLIFQVQCAWKDTIDCSSLICLYAENVEQYCHLSVCVSVLVWVNNEITRSLAIANRPCDCCIILKSGSYTKAYSTDAPISIKSRS